MEYKTVNKEIESYKTLSDEIFLTIIDFDEYSKYIPPENNTNQDATNNNPMSKEEDPFSITITDEGVCSAVIFWFKLYLDQDDTIVIDSRKHHWKTCICNIYLNIVLTQ